MTSILVILTVALTMVFSHDSEEGISVGSILDGAFWNPDIGSMHCLTSLRFSESDFSAYSFNVDVYGIRYKCATEDLYMYYGMYMAPTGNDPTTLIDTSTFNMTLTCDGLLRGLMFYDPFSFSTSPSDDYFTCFSFYGGSASFHAAVAGSTDDYYYLMNYAPLPSDTTGIAFLSAQPVPAIEVLMKASQVSCAGCNGNGDCILSGCECDNADMDASANCGSCVTANYDITRYCGYCEDGYDIDTNCAECRNEYDPDFSCSACKPNYDIDSDCTRCVNMYDITTNCTECLGNYDSDSNCTECSGTYDVSFMCLAIECTEEGGDGSLEDTYFASMIGSSSLFIVTAGISIVLCLLLLIASACCIAVTGWKVVGMSSSKNRRKTISTKGTDEDYELKSAMDMLN